MIIPKENVKDLKDVPKNILKGISILEVTHMDQVLLHALLADEVFIQPADSVPKSDLPLPETVLKEQELPVTSH